MVRFFFKIAIGNEESDTFGLDLKQRKSTAVLERCFITSELSGFDAFSTIVNDSRRFETIRRDSKRFETMRYTCVHIPNALLHFR